jgi:predicted enzyme related to lactoylglutathione lyase
MTGWAHLALRVADLTSAVERIQASGGSVASAPTAARRPDTSYAYVTDPEGNLIELVTSTPPI